MANEGGQDVGLPAPKPDLKPNSENVLDKFPQVSVVDAEKGFVSGRQLKERGQEIAVRDIFGDDPYAEVKRLVYFRTVSGNVCQMEKVGGRLVLRSAKDALLKKREGIGFENYLDWEDQVGNGKFRVGDPFFLTPSIPIAGGNSSSIGEIEEIVIVDPGAISDPNHLNQLPKNLIIEDFGKLSGKKAGLSPEPQQEEDKAVLQKGTEIVRKGQRGLAELADLLRSDKKLEFFEKTIPVLRTEKQFRDVFGDRRDAELTLSMGIGGKIKPEELEASGEVEIVNSDGQKIKLNLVVAKITHWLKEARLLSNFQGNEGLEVYRGIADAVGKGDIQRYSSVMVKSRNNPQIKEVAEAIVYDLVAENKAKELINFLEMDRQLVMNIVKKIAGADSPS